MVEQRIAELGGRTSLLNPLWYAGSLAIGFAAGKLGDAWNLGFLKETERQVERHLQGHISTGSVRQTPVPGRWSQRCSATKPAMRGTAEALGARELATARQGRDGGRGESDDDGVVPGLTGLRPTKKTAARRAAVSLLLGRQKLNRP